MKIARSFNCGIKPATVKAPQGRQKREDLFRSSLRDSPVSNQNPAVETAGYCQSSLRDGRATGLAGASPVLLLGTGHEPARTGTSQNFQSRIISVPQGQMKIARSFNCGIKPETDKAPEGRQKRENLFRSSHRDSPVSIRYSGLWKT
jgi:hypothetical protein